MRHGSQSMLNILCAVCAMHTALPHTWKDIERGSSSLFLCLLTTQMRRNVCYFIYLCWNATERNQTTQLRRRPFHLRSLIRYCLTIHTHIRLACSSTKAYNWIKTFLQLHGVALNELPLPLLPQRWKSAVFSSFVRRQQSASSSWHKIAKGCEMVLSGSFNNLHGNTIPFDVVDLIVLGSVECYTPIRAVDS